MPGLNKTPLVLTLASGLSLFSACGLEAPHVEKQINGYIKPQSYPERSEGLRLTENASSAKVTYEGPIIFWQEDVKPLDLAEIIKAKQSIMDADLSYKRDAFYVDKLKLEAEQLRAKIAANESHIVKTLDLDRLYGEQQTQLLEAAKVWVDQQIVDDVSKQEFAQFCQAQIWRMATLPVLKNYRFSRRPRPLGLCEPYYLEQGYFQGESCAEAQDNEKGKDYFPCFWGPEGIGKTQIKYLSMASDKLGQELEGDERKKTLDLLKSDKWQKEHALSSIWESNMITLPDGQSYLLDFEGLMVKSLTDVLGGYRFLNDSNRDQEVILKALVEERTSEKVNGQEASKYAFNDRLYNLAFIAQSPGQPTISMSLEDVERLMQLAKEAKEIFGLGIGQEELAKLKALQQDNSKTREKIAHFDSLVTAYEQETELGGLGHQLFQKYDRWMKARADISAIINEKSMADAFWPYVALSLERQDGLVKLTFQIDNKGRETLPAIACYNALKLLEVPCADTTTASKFVPIHLKFDENRGKLDILINAGKQTDFYLPPTPYTQANAPYFQAEHLSQLFLGGKTLHLELYLGEHQQELPILTGKGFIEEGNRQLAEANVSLSKAAL